MINKHLKCRLVTEPIADPVGRRMIRTTLILGAVVFLFCIFCIYTLSPEGPDTVLTNEGKINPVPIEPEQVALTEEKVIPEPEKETRVWESDHTRVVFRKSPEEVKRLPPEESQEEEIDPRELEKNLLEDEATKDAMW